MSDHIFGRIQTWTKNHRNRSLSIAMAGVIFLSGAGICVWDYHNSTGKKVEEIARNSYGKGKKTQELKVKEEDQVLGEIPVEITEQVYDSQQIQRVFRQVTDKMDKLILGENTSLNHVDRDLNLITTIPGKAIDVTWKLDRYDVMNIYGKLKEEKLVSSGTKVELTAVLTYRENPEKQALYECAVMIYPKMDDSGGTLLEQVRLALDQKDQDTREQKIFKMPEQVNGKQVEFYPVMNQRGIVLMLAAVMITGLLFALDRQNEAEKMKIRKEQMVLDYPEVLSKLTLLLGAGMTVRRAWMKIVKDYEQHLEPGKEHAVYEEMKYTCRQMDGGVPEAQSYENFGRRCAAREYMRLGALLSQNLRKGTKGLTDLLRMEQVQALEERKSRARKAGEEAGTKLLLPMFLMLGEVLVIVVVPAFLSVQM